MSSSSSGESMASPTDTRLAARSAETAPAKTTLLGHGAHKNIEKDDWNPFARVSFGFMNPLFRLGAARPLALSDCGLVAEDERVRRVSSRFEAACADENRLPRDKRSSCEICSLNCLTE